MAYPMLGKFEFENKSSSEVNAKFQIPTNCDISTSYDNGEVTITIELKTGQREPTLTFQEVNEELSIDSDNLVLTFEQRLENETIRKPRAIIEL